MKSHLSEEIRIANPRFHHSTRDGLYAPIAFMFVTEHMRDDIVAERQMLLSSLPPALQERQLRLFARYDPAVSAAAFKRLLQVYAPSGCATS
ncbi:MAG: hypothetical protein ACYC5W_13795 [Thauera sp.]|jgi:hypothetical protein